MTIIEKNETKDNCSTNKEMIKKTKELIKLNPLYCCINI